MWYIFHAVTGNYAAGPFGTWEEAAALVDGLPPGQDNVEVAYVN